MDRNQAIGFGLIALLLLAYSFFFAGPDENAERLRRVPHQGETADEKRSD